MPASYGYIMTMHAWPFIKCMHAYLKCMLCLDPYLILLCLCSLLYVLWPSIPRSYAARLRLMLFNRTYRKLLYHYVQLYEIEYFTKTKQHDTNESLSNFVRLTQIVEAVA